MAHALVEAGEAMRGLLMDPFIALCIGSVQREFGADLMGTTGWVARFRRCG